MDYHDCLFVDGCDSCDEVIAFVPWVKIDAVTGVAFDLFLVLRMQEDSGRGD